MPDYTELDKEQLRALLRALRIQNGRKPTRATMAKIRAVQAALKAK